MHHTNQRELPRQGIIRTLHNSIATHVLTVVTAPAGYGKTIIAGRLTGKKTYRRFFYSVPDETASVGQWWNSLVDCLANQGLERAAVLRRIGFPRNASTTRRVMDFFESVSTPFVLIIDDFHIFADPAIDGFLEAIIRAGPSSHRLALFSRVKPRLNLDEMEQAGLAKAYDQKLLTFSEAEAIRFFFLNGVADKKAAKRAWRYSEGWIAALWLCLQNRKSGKETLPSVSIENLLDEAVFSGYSAADQEFLMRLAVLGSFSVREAKTLTLCADTSERLRDMSDGNAFIRYDAAGDRYVFHSIFREFLVKKLAARAETNTPELHRRAAECHIQRKDSLPAFRQLLKAGGDDDLLRILEVIVSDGKQSIYEVKRNGFLPIIEKIPWRLRFRQPLGYLLFIWLCFDDGLDDPASVALFEEMAERFASAEEIPAAMKRRLAGEVEFMRGWIYTNVEPQLLPSRYDNACAILKGPSILRYERRCWNFGAPHMLFVYLPKNVRYSGEFDRLAPAVASMDVLSGGVIAGCDFICNAEYRLERGEFEAAARLIDDLEQILDFPWNLTSLVVGTFSRARLLSVTGDEKKAAAMLAGLLSRIESVDSSEHIQCAELAQGYVLASVGQADAAPQWLQDCDILDHPYGVRRIRGFMITVCGKLLLAKGDLDGLANFLADKREFLESAESAFGGIHAAAFKAILAWRRSDADALEHMREAIELSRPEGFVLSLGEYGRHILPMLRRLNKAAPGDGHLKKIVEMAERYEVIQQRHENRAKHTLTTREREIMRLVAKGKSSAVIAAKLGFSLSQAKYALSLAYRKLGAKNRTEAARLFRFASQKGASANPSFARMPRPSAGPHIFQVPSCRDLKNELHRLRSSLPANAVPADSADRDRMIAEALTRQGRLLPAFYFYLRAGRDEDLGRSLDLFSLPESGEMTAFCFEEIHSAVQSFPWPVRMARPMGYLAFLWRYFRVFARGTSGVELDEFEHRLASAESDSCDSPGKLAGETTLLRSLLQASDAEAFWNSHEDALRLLGGPSQFYSRETSWTFGNPHLSFGLVRDPGGFDGMASRIARAAKTVSALSGGKFVSLDAAFHLERHLERAEMDAAHALLPELENRGGDDMQALIMAAFSRSRLLLAQGRRDAAVDLLESLQPRVNRSGSFEHAASLDLALGYVLALLGRIGAIPSWIRAGNVISPPHGSTVRCPFAAVVYGKTLLAAGNFSRLESAARTMPIRFGRFDSLLGRIHAKTMEAIAAQYHRNENRALACLEEALELSRTDRLVFAIAEYRKFVLPLLHRLRRENPGDSHLKRVAAFAEQSHRNILAGDDFATNKHVLTRREREIMNLVVQGTSNADIARKLGVSDSRITKALSSIYAKLSVSNRVEASQRFTDGK